MAYFFWTTLYFDSSKRMADPEAIKSYSTISLHCNRLSQVRTVLLMNHKIAASVVC